MAYMSSDGLAIVFVVNFAILRQGHFECVLGMQAENNLLLGYNGRIVEQWLKFTEI
jgi:hypothetical protein